MAIPVLMPKQGNSVESCLILDWAKKEGETIALGEILCEAETDKATIEIESPAAGTVLKIFFEVDEDVPVQQLIAIIGDPGEDISEYEKEAATEPSKKEGQLEPSPSDSEPSASEPSASEQLGLQSGASETVLSGVGVSPRARNTAARKGLDPAALSGSGPGGRVIERDVLAAAITGPDLTPAARDGVSAGLSVPMAGTGLGGRVRLADLGAAGSPSPVGIAYPEVPSPGPFSETPVKSIRKIVAGRMRESLASTAQLTHNSAADVSGLLAYRRKCKVAAEELGVKNLSLNDMFLYLVSRVLKAHPVLNSHWLGDKYLTFERIHMGFAVDSPRGLMVPVIKNIDLMNLKQISAEARRLATACRDGNIVPDDLTGATFTTSNLGAMGIESFTPIINPPEVGILGICASVLRPVQVGEELLFRPFAGLSLTYDHQLVDGAPASRFLMDLRSAIENFDLYLAG